MTAALVWQTIREGVTIGLLAALAYYAIAWCRVAVEIWKRRYEFHIARVADADEMVRLRAAMASVAKILVVNHDPDGDMIESRYDRSQLLEWGVEAPELVSYLGEREEWEGRPSESY